MAAWESLCSVFGQTFYSHISFLHPPILDASSEMQARKVEMGARGWGGGGETELECCDFDWGKTPYYLHNLSL